MANQKIKGLEVLLYVKVGEDMVAIGGQRGASLSMSADELDVTDKTTDQYKTFLVGLKEWSISCDGLVVTDETAYGALVQAFLDGETIDVELKGAGFGYKGTVAIASMDFDAQYDDALTYSCELKGASKLDKITEGAEE